MKVIKRIANIHRLGKKANKERWKADQEIVSKQHLEKKRPGERKVNNRFEVELKEDGGDSTRQT